LRLGIKTPIYGVTNHQHNEQGFTMKKLLFAGLVASTFLATGCASLSEQDQASLSGAIKTAESAEQTASAIKGTADSALSTANAAQSRADAAYKKAEEALAAALAAQRSADEANERARRMLDKASRK
jgi:hypothetical protein